MGFLDKAKQAANELAAKADTALGEAGLGGSSADTRETDQLLRELGLQTWNEQTGTPVDPAERARVLDALRGLEREGRLVVRAPQGPPPPPGAAGSAPPPPPPPGAAQSAPPPPPPPPSDS